MDYLGKHFTSKPRGTTIQERTEQLLQAEISRNDRMLPLLNGDVSIDGYELDFVEAEPSEIFWRALQEGEFDITEMSLAAYAILTARGESQFVGLDCIHLTNVSSWRDICVASVWHHITRAAGWSTYWRS